MELALDGDINLKTGHGGEEKLMMCKHDAVQNLSRRLNSSVLLQSLKPLSHGHDGVRRESGARFCAGFVVGM